VVLTYVSVEINDFLWVFELEFEILLKLFLELPEFSFDVVFFFDAKEP